MGFGVGWWLVVASIIDTEGGAATQVGSRLLVDWWLVVGSWLQVQPNMHARM